MVRVASQKQRAALLAQTQSRVVVDVIATSRARGRAAAFLLPAVFLRDRGRRHGDSARYPHNILALHNVLAC